MKILKTFEEFTSIKTDIQEDVASPGKDSKVVVDDFTMDSGTEIKSVEIVGAIVANETEKEFKEYFYEEYGEGAFTEADMASLVKYYNEYTEEENAEQAEKEKEEEEAEEGGEEEDPLAGLGV